MIWIALVLFGLVFGSCAAALSYRLPRGIPVVADHSRCTSCQTTLTARDLVPLLSWLLARGHCRYCGAAVSWRYPALEIAMALVFCAAWWFEQPDLVQTVLLALTGFGLLVIVVADLEQGIIPDAILLFLLPLAILWRWRTGGAWTDGALGLILAVGLSWGLRAGFKAMRGYHGLGFGDVKFFGVAGIFVGLTGMGQMLVVSGVVGLALGLLWRMVGRGSVFPFAPALCGALFFGLVSRGP